MLMEFEGYKVSFSDSRKQAASCQKVLGGFANIAGEYATKRYRSNCINWGILPLRTETYPDFPVDSLILIRDIRRTLESGERNVSLELLDGTGNVLETRAATLDSLTREEADILLSGCLINYYRGT